LEYQWLKRDVPNILGEKYGPIGSYPPVYRKDGLNGYGTVDAVQTVD
jgi:hypothetical protein